LAANVSRCKYGQKCFRESNIVPRAFGEHEVCKESYQQKPKEIPKNYHHNDLPEGRDLIGEDLRAAIEDALLLFMNEDAAKKMAPAGSSQCNEFLNSVIGSKAPKIRHYGGSKSADFKKAPGTAQYISTLWKL